MAGKIIYQMVQAKPCYLDLMKKDRQRFRQKNIQPSHVDYRTGDWQQKAKQN
jgi:hypothetical protein